MNSQMGDAGSGIVQHPDADMLNAYLDEAIAQDERRQVDEHLATCADCRQELAELRVVRDLLRGLPQLDPPRSFQLGAEHQRRNPSETAMLRLLPLIRTLSVAAVIAFMVLGGVVFAGRLSSESNSATKENSVAMAPAPTSVVAANEVGTGSDAESSIPTEEAQGAQDRRSAVPSGAGNLSSMPIDRGESASTDSGSPGIAAGADLAKGVATAEGASTNPQSTIDQGAPLSSESVDNSSNTSGKPWVMTTIGLGLLAAILLGLWILLARMSKHRRIGM